MFTTIKCDANLTLASLSMVAALILNVETLWAGNTEDGVAAFDAKNYTEAFRLLQPAAEQGAVKAQGLLSRMYMNGWGTSKNENLALKWAQLAASQGNLEGQYVLGVIYHLGQGVQQDYKEAVKWYQLAAAQGNARAQNNLGVMYERGEGVRQD